MINEINLTDKILRYAKKKTLYNLIGKAVSFAILLTILWFGAALTDHFFYFSEFTRWGLWFLNISIIIYLLCKFLIAPLLDYNRLKRGCDLSAYAEEIGQLEPQNQDRLLNAYHLIIRPRNKGVSEGLTLAATKSANKMYRLSDFASVLKMNRFMPSKVVIPVLISILFLIITFWPGLTHSTLRLLNPSNEYLVIPMYSFRVAPGSVSCIKGHDIKIRSVYQGPVLGTVDLYIMKSSDDSQPRILSMATKNDTLMTALGDVRSSFYYKIKGNPLNNPGLENRIWSDIYHIDVKSLPVVRNLDVKVTPPFYTGLSIQHLDRNIGDFLALPGSRAEIKIEADKPLSSAQIVFSSGKKIDMTGKNRKFRTTFSILADGSYHFEIIDTTGLQNVNPIRHQFTLMDDALPFVEITEPGRDIETSLDVTIEINASAYDDFGIKAAYLVHRNIRHSELLTDTNWVKSPLQYMSGNRQQQEFSFLWNFNKLPLSFDDGLEYYALVKDNRIGKPGYGRSRIFTIHFPSLDDIFADVNNQQQDHTDRFEEISKKTEDLQKMLKDINRELKREKNIDWEKKQQIKEALEKQQNLQKELDQIKKELDETIRKLEKNNAISEEILDKYSRVQELFEEIATPELRDAIRELQKAVAENNVNKTKRALENFQLNQEAFKKQLDRTYELLKKAHLEQKMDQLVQLSKDLTEQQRKLTQELNSDKLDPQDMKNRLARKEREIEQRLEKLKQQVDHFKNEPKISEYTKTRENLQKASDQMADSAFKSQMNQTQNSLSKQLKADAQQGAQNLTDQFEKIENSLSQAQDEMLQQSKNEIEQKMKGMMNKMLTLSHEQEKLQRETRRTSPLSDGLQVMTQKQGQMMNNFQKMVSEMVELSNETFFIDRDIGRSLGKTQRQMMKSLEQLSERNTRGASQSQKEAMKNLNLGSQQMQGALDRLAKSQSGLGLEKFMEDMKKMAGMQGQLNSQTLGLMPGEGNQGGMSVERQAAMRRIAAEQNSLRQSLEEMTGQMGDRGDIAGRLGNIGKQMDEVIEDLLNNNVSRKTINRQQQILSRMLDAQKSMTARKKSKKRQAEQAKNYAVGDPRQLGNTTDFEKEVLQEALKRAKNEGYSNDYQKLIEIYFKRLMQENTGEKNNPVN